MKTAENAIQSYHNQHLIHLGELLSIEQIGGGSINQAFKVSLGTQTAFVKVNEANAFPDMFAKEKLGLELMANVIPHHVPAVLACGEENNHQLLFLEWIEPAGSTELANADAGKALANLHQHHAELFGLKHDNYMGSLVQKNSQTANFTDFYIDNRIEPQVRLAVSEGVMDKQASKGFENFYKRLDELIPKEPASLVHGDLWRGNLLFSRDEVPYFVDPAIAFNHREVDLAMLKLFGNPSEVLFETYEDFYPTQPNRIQREKYFQLYPLLIHLNLFGQAYLRDVLAIIKPFA